MRKSLVVVSWLLLAVLTMPIQSKAQPLVFSGPLSKAQAVARATSAGFDVRAAQADSTAAQARAAQGRAALLPQLSVSGTGVDANLPQFGMPVARQTYLSATASVPLLDFANGARARAESLSARAAADDLLSARNDAALAAYHAYDRAALAAGVSEARRVDFADQQANVDLVALRVRVGKAARYQLARAQAGLALARQAAEDADAERDEALNDLKVTLDFDLSSQVILSDGLGAATVADSLADFEARVLAQRPDVTAAKARLDSADAALRQAKAEYAPTASLSGQTYNGASHPPLGAAGSQVGVSISLPLLDGGRRSAQVTENSAALDKARVEYERAALMAQDDVANAWRELHAARTNVQTAESALTSAQENLRVARLRERAGKGIELEILDALSLLASARETALRAQARVDLAVAGLHHAAGDPL
jgi:outer membrane protein TolC